MQHTPAPPPNVATDLAVARSELLAALTGLLAHERDALANSANMAAIVYELLPQLNWAGWYFQRGDELVLGPFQGRPACVRIPRGRGVCGAAAARRTSVLVEDVHAFPDHIACDSASRSELVVPVLAGDRLLGVFDLDSPVVGRFTPADQDCIEQAVRLWVQGSALDAWPLPPARQLTL
jgi:GAF domain-containing protein